MRMRGFTLVELAIVVAALGIIASGVIIYYSGSQRRASDSLAYSAIDQATSVLETYQVPSSDYPPNIAGTGYVAPDGVAIALFTNAPQVRSYTAGTLDADQNAQLLLNSCNAFMPITSGSTTYNTGCSFAGQNVHVSGQVSSNVVIHGPVVQESDFVLTCGSVCTTAQAAIIQSFKAQGGVFPITVPKKQVSLPTPNGLTTYGDASRYCLEVRSTRFPDIVYRTTDQSSVPVTGDCPADPNLHYP